LLKSSLSVGDISVLLKNMEAASGRVRPSHQISLDVDLIAWGENLEHMQFNPKKLPLALDVKIPMFDVWKDNAFQHQAHVFPTVSCLEAK
jgi:2-amino-4-hydroxy-6-hydroxymethyldihydropteridine diphosphokinase